ncbi:hypothetical protein IJ22_03170 [Paenibacillus naphthalenovorans]|uniref:Uncharacterized protein n=1 Tax=Paenibacillus naphthalenovorans TaxID=162209 RepID=A0A0U2KVT1_9BACL|nr:hypothetical protein IJ22_03170 [Paenibacillus naphthalenovorans]SDI24723.1 hypothetical protein SAMN05421868_104203 [Paenibacillus naphthalenovorans]
MGLQAERTISDALLFFAPVEFLEIRQFVKM